MDNLSKCAREARKKGMSYGKLMAQKWDQGAGERARLAAARAKREQQKKIDAGWIPCANPECRQMFLPRNRCHRYCGPVCANTDWKRKEKEARQNERNQSEVHSAD